MNDGRIEIIGWYGTSAILVAYFLVSMSLVQPSGIVYQMLNITGAAGLIIETWKKKDLQPLALNVVWIIIAIVALARSTGMFSR